jgi:CheY-like chemotaxis protein
MAHSLRTVGYDVDVAETADEASRRLDVQFYGVVVADWRLPDRDGIELADRAGRLGAKTLIVSGYLFMLPPAATARQEVTMKPVRPGELAAAIRRAIGSANEP